MSDEVEVMDLISEVMEEATAGVNEQMEAQVASKDEGSPPKSATGRKKPDTSDSQEDKSLDFGDMPNGQIRYEKLKKQGTEQNEKILELEKKLARAKGREEVLVGKEDADEDPKQYMTDDEIEQYDKDQKVEKLELEIANMKLEKQKEMLKSRDAIFFKQHPGLNNPEFKEGMMAFIKGKEGTAKDLLAGTTSLEEVYGMMNPVKSREAKTQDSDKVFGSSSTESPPARTGEKRESNVEQAKKVLHDPNSTNKADASEALLNDIVSGIFDFS